MGADGGVCWIPLHDPSKYDRVLELLRPFYFLTSVDDYHWSNVEWIDNNAHLIKGCVFGTYGTSQEFSLRESLVQILDPECGDVCADPSLTFLELVEDLETRPFTKDNDWGDPAPQDRWCYLSEGWGWRGPIKNMRDWLDPNGCRPTKLEQMLWSLAKTEHGFMDDALFPIAEMKISDWVEELRSLLDYSASDLEETWT